MQRERLFLAGPSQREFCHRLHHAFRSAPASGHKIEQSNQLEFAFITNRRPLCESVESNLGPSSWSRKQGWGSQRAAILVIRKETI